MMVSTQRISEIILIIAGLCRRGQAFVIFGFSSITLRILSEHCSGLLRVSFMTDSGILQCFFGSSSTFFDKASVLTEELPKKCRRKGEQRAKNSRMIPEEYPKNFRSAVGKLPKCLIRNKLHQRYCRSYE